MSIFDEADQNDIPGNESIADAHARVALEQWAMVSVRLAIARWRNGNLGPKAPLSARDTVAARGRWYTQAQNHFQEWLSCGGFAQSETGGNFVEAGENANRPVSDHGSRDVYID